MTALSLLDILVRSETAEESSDHPSRLPSFVERLIDDALADHQRLGEYERRFALPTTPEDELDVLRAIWRLYDRWAEEAEALLARARPVAAAHPLPNLDRLRNAYARVRARLSVTPEKIVNAKEQAARGDVMPGEELRHELQARLRR